MFDIGFAELIIIAVVSLLVIGPERLPEAVRTATLWLNRLKRGFNDIKREVQQELHNDAVMQELRKTGEQLRQEASGLSRDVRRAVEPSGKTAPETPLEGADVGAALPPTAITNHPEPPASPDQQGGGDKGIETPAERKPE